MDERFKQVDERFDEMDESIQSQLGSLQQDLTNHVRRVAVVTSAHDIWNELQKSENWLHMKKSDFTANSELCVKVRMSRTAMKSVTWLRTGQLKHSVTVGYDKRGKPTDRRRMAAVNSRTLANTHSHTQHTGERRS